MKTIVVSAVNLRKGGTLTILRDCLSYLSKVNQGNNYRIIALVHKKELAQYDHIEYIEIPWTVRSWLLRLWCEYITMFRISKRLGDIDLWLSLHDTTPNVVAKHRAVYCHNPFPFYQWKWRDLFVNYRITCFAWFSKYIYRINIHKNNWVLVQQQWLRRSFTDLFGIDKNQIIVTLPTNNELVPNKSQARKGATPYCFIFPSYADIHKNFDILCSATMQLEREVGANVFKVVLTIGGHENTYARQLKRKWGRVASITFAGFMSREDLYKHYEQADCLVFPSKVETWGLPISEFGAFNKPMLLADLPYAHETSAGCSQVAFFPANDPQALMSLMKRLIQGDRSMLSPNPQKEIPQPTAKNWQELFDHLLQE